MCPTFLQILKTGLVLMCFNQGTQHFIDDLMLLYYPDNVHLYRLSVWQILTAIANIYTGFQIGHINTIPMIGRRCVHAHRAL